MGKTLSDVPKLVEQRKPFTIASMSAENYYPDGIRYNPDRGWNEVIWPHAGALYIVYSFATPIAWINEYGQAIKADQYFSQRTRRHQGLLWDFKDDAKLRGTKRQRDGVTKGVATAHGEYYAAEAERKRLARNEAARNRRAREKEQLRLQRERMEEQRLAREQLDREAAEAIASIVAGAPMSPVLLGVEGEREAIESLLITRHA